MLKRIFKNGQSQGFNVNGSNNVLLSWSDHDVDKRYVNGQHKKNGYASHQKPVIEEGPCTTLIKLHGITKVYKTEAGPFQALKGIDLEIIEGEFVAVVGKSGSGKSTLINMLTGIDHPSAGTVCIGQTGLHELDEGQMAVWRGQNLGIVFQFFQLLPTLTIIENVMIPMDLAGKYEFAERQERAIYLLDQVDMAGDAHMFPAAVSGGQQQRVAIARALANDPPIVVADEPTGNLDSQSADTVFKLFEKLSSEGKTILMVTHDDELANRVPRTITIADGQVVDEVVRASSGGRKSGGI